ncbi:MAG TPA: hypothetical protein VG435_01060, partial [Acidimicrobiales bacterium]|nr:hypothetical protein [Acidimicrobiales bacterium]
MRRWWIVLSSTLSVTLGTLGLATVVAPAASALPADTLVFTSTPTTVAQGLPFSVTVSAQNAGVTDTSYSGTVSLTSTTDSGFSPPATVTAVNGVATFTTVEFSSAAFGAQNLTASGAGPAADDGTTNINVYGPATKLVFSSAPGLAKSGSSFNVGVTAEDSSGDTDLGFTDTVSFSLSDTDGNAVLPANYTYTIGDSGTHTFPVTLVKGDAGQTINVADLTDGSVSNGATGIEVLPSSFAVSAPSTATAGETLSVSITAKDSDNTDDPAYAGTAHLTSTDGQFSAANVALSAGAATTSAVLKTAGNQTITATDSVDTSITGTSSDVAVSPAALSQVVATGPASATAGHAFAATFTAEDPFGNTETSDNGSISVTSTIGTVTPSTDNLASGVVTDNFTINQTGTGTISAGQTGGGTPVASNSFTVAPGTATKLVISTVPSETAGTADASGVIITVEDAHDNVVTGDDNGLTVADNAGSGTVTPITATLSNGSVTIHPTFSKTGSQHLSVADPSDSITATASNDFMVVPGALASFDVVPSTTSPDEGVPFSVTITAKDADGNVKTDYSGPFIFQTTDALDGIFPSGNQSLTNGSATFTGIVLYGSGDQNIDVK